MKVLVTGAAGFVGAEAVRSLLEAGHEVGALLSPAGRADRLREVESRVTVLRGDLRDEAAVRLLIRRWLPEACLHLAWYVEPGQYLHSVQNAEMLNAGLSLIRTLGEVGCRRFVGAGTCFEYDVSRGWLREDGPVHPETLYAAAKLSLGVTGRHLACQSQMSFAWGRLFYLYGLSEDPRRVIPALFSSVFSNQPFPATLGEQVRDYLYLADVAQAYRFLVEADAEGVFNVSSGVPITMAHLLTTAAAAAGRSDLLRLGALPYRAWEPPFICGDNSRLRGLGWKPAYDLASGLALAANGWEAR